MDRNVAVQGHGVQGCRRETSSKGCLTELPVYHCCYVWCYVTWLRMETQMFVCCLQAAHVSVLLRDNSRTLQMFSTSLVDVSSQSWVPAACFATDFTPAQDGHELLSLVRRLPPFPFLFLIINWPKILENTKEMAKSMV